MTQSDLLLGSGATESTTTTDPKVLVISLSPWGASRASFSGRSVVVTFGDLEPGLPVYEAPEWLDAFAERVIEIEALPQDWDSYGALPVHRTALHALTRVLRKVANYASTAPTVAPTSSGGIRCEWANNDYELSLIAEPSGAVTVYFANLALGAETEQELTEGLDIRFWVLLASKA
jgi:hypothetical protein